MTKDEALRQALEALENFGQGNSDVCRAIKEALAQPEGEPVAWATHHEPPMFFYTKSEAALYCDYDESPIPVYTSPPKREWHGLTGYERDTIVRMAGDSLDAICLTESKLEEKNT